MARGFGATRGSASTDRIDTALTSHVASRSWAIRYNRNGTSGNQRMWFKATGASNTGFDTGLWGSNLIIFGRDYATTDGTWSVADVTPTTNSWHGLVVTHDGTTALPAMYIDGSSRTVTANATPAGALQSNSDPYRIGNDRTNVEPWQGDLAEFAVWDRILTAAEANAISAGASPLLFPTGLVEYVPLVRDVVSVKNAAPTVTGTAVQVHPRVWYPRAPRALTLATVGGGAQTVTPDHISSTTSLHAPTVTPGLVTVTPGHIASTTTLHAPTVTQGGITVVPEHISSTVTLHSPTVTPGSVIVVPDHISSTSVLYAPTLTLGISVGHIASTATLHSPSVTPGAVTVTPGHISSGTVLYAPVVTGGDVVTFDYPLSVSVNGPRSVTLSQGRKVTLG